MPIKTEADRQPFEHADAHVQQRIDNAQRAFSAELEEAKEELRQNFIGFHKKLAIEAMRRIVLRTPVDTGRARGNWRLTIGELPTEPTDQVDKGGGATIEDGIARLQLLGVGEVVYISNSLPYILRLEDGHSDRSPEGMVEVTLEELRQGIR